ncbi:polyprenyl synthetase family protein [Streptomyces sp. NPDC056632]|uniref:polyprenyl synthetase family protein n=1 Tax=Streptomyces sp. NPDC056632 TaxID=3345884 RepID=UPI0036B44575
MTVAEFCPPTSHLHAPVTAIVRAARAAQGPESNRLLPLAVLGAISGDPAPAAPVCVVSSLWSAGAEAVDDLVDLGAAAEPVAATLTPAELLVAGTVCLTQLPALAIERLDIPEALARQWRRDLAEGTLTSADGQLADTARDPHALDWGRVMRAYRAKTGSSYARDALMAARCAVDEPAALRAWHVLGQLLGVLRQVHNDNAERTPEDDEDLANGTPTLLLSHALEAASPEERGRLFELRSLAREDLGARAELRGLLHMSSCVAGYRARIGALHARAHGLLERLAEPSPYRTVIRSRIDDSAALAIPEHTRIAE